MTLTIQLDDTTRIRRADSLNVVIEEYREGGINRKTGERGESKWVILGYYSSLESALSAVPLHLAMSPAVTSLAVYKQRWDGMCRAFTRGKA